MASRKQVTVSDIRQRASAAYRAINNANQQLGTIMASAAGKIDWLERVIAKEAPTPALYLAHPRYNELQELFDVAYEIGAVLDQTAIIVESKQHGFALYRGATKVYPTNPNSDVIHINVVPATTWIQ